MEPSTLIHARPEAMGDVPGICELPLTRAVVQYRAVHEMDSPGGRIEDIGLALVVEGRYASSAEAVDLGSGKLKVLDLSTELVVLDWVYEPTLEHVVALITETAANQGAEALRRYGFRLGMTVLERVGFGPLSRPTFLRVGYRDICRDFDLHEGTSIRFVLGPGRLTRAHLDYDTCALVFRTAFTEPDVLLEGALSEAFPRAELRRTEPLRAHDAIDYHVRMRLPTDMDETRACLASMRQGLGALMSRFEPARFDLVEQQMATFGASETLASLRMAQARVRAVPVLPHFAGSQVVN